MKGIIIGQDQDTYFVSDNNGKRYQFMIQEWAGKNAPKVGDCIDFAYEDGVVNSVFPMLKQQSQQSKTVLALICFFTGLLGIHRFMVGKIWTGILMLILSLSFTGLIISGTWAIIDFIVIVAGQFTDKCGNKIT
ncbi:putative membrane protein [Bartonella australis AUST/NH1]|uniref:Putative membrane protein n=1 Tax=Bartonella australis (strain Aust/NH1) TaxID=1094489 RepID=M1NY26_BARAA|nr:TM2 domain-containing protein [Bartonella australis]AGF74377.1 putative membrane protein [Bartonella australis AUST/NH1]